MNIVLTGFMASGKTQISKVISELTGVSLVDTDAVIEQNTGLTINDIFEKHGENKFRDIEHGVIKDVSELDNTVISTGGGVVLNSENITLLRKNGIIINLSPDFDTILERLNVAKATRPLLKNSDIESIRKRFTDRLPFYADCDIKINVSNEHTPQYFAEQIMKLIQE